LPVSSEISDLYEIEEYFGDYFFDVCGANENF